MRKKYGLIHVIMWSLFVGNTLLLKNHNLHYDFERSTKSLQHKIPKGYGSSVRVKSQNISLTSM
jgi:hypothetical protein